MSYLNRLKKSKTPEVGTAKTAKSPFGSFGSSDIARFQKKHSIETPADSAKTTLPKWCRVDCPNLEGVDLPGEGSVAGCLRVEPDIERWTRLEWLKGCPLRSGRGADR